MFAAMLAGDDVPSILRQRMAKLADVADLLPAIGTVAMDSQKKDIEESRSPDGAPYPPLKHPRRPKRVGIPSMWGGGFARMVTVPHPYGDKPELDTTNMYQSIHYEVRPPDSVFAGPSLEQAPYFPYQNQGAPAAHIPPRAFIGLRTEDNVTIEDIVVRRNAAIMGNS